MSKPPSKILIFSLELYFLNDALKKLVKEFIRSSLVSEPIRIEGKQRKMKSTINTGLTQLFNMLACCTLASML